MLVASRRPPQRLEDLRRFRIVAQVGAGGELESVLHWRSVLRSYAVEHGVVVIYAGLAGFEGGKGMTGSSTVIDPFGDTVVTAPALGAHVLSAELDFTDIDIARARLPLLGDLNAVLPDLLQRGGVL